MAGALEQARQVGGCKCPVDMPKVDHTCLKWTLRGTCTYVIMAARWRKVRQVLVGFS